MLDHSPSFEEVTQLDSMLHQLALYDVAGGMLFIPESIDQLVDFQKKVAQRFNYLKGLIKRGECTIDFLRDAILKKNGPFFTESKTYEQEAEYIVNSVKEGKFIPAPTNEEVNEDEFDNVPPIIKDLVDSTFPNLSAEQKKDIINSSGLNFIPYNTNKDIKKTIEKHIAKNKSPLKIKRKYERKDNRDHKGKTDPL